MICDEYTHIATIDHSTTDVSDDTDGLYLVNGVIQGTIGLRKVTCESAHFTNMYRHSGGKGDNYVEWRTSQYGSDISQSKIDSVCHVLFPGWNRVWTDGQRRRAVDIIRALEKDDQ